MLPDIDANDSITQTVSHSMYAPPSGGPPRSEGYAFKDTVINHVNNDAIHRRYAPPPGPPPPGGYIFPEIAANPLE